MAKVSVIVPVVSAGFVSAAAASVASLPAAYTAQPHPTKDVRPKPIYRILSMFDPGTSTVPEGSSSTPRSHARASPGTTTDVGI